MKRLIITLFFLISLSILNAQTWDSEVDDIQGVPLPEWKTTPADISSHLVKYQNSRTKRHIPEFQSANQLLEISPLNSGLSLKTTSKTASFGREKSFSDLKLIPNIYLTPHRYNVFVLMQDKNGQEYQCSGVLIDPKLVLLAGHCVHNLELFNGFAKKIKVIPAYNHRTLDIFGYAEYKNIYVEQAWRDNQNLDHNLAYIELDRPIGASLSGVTIDNESNTKWFSYASESSIDYMLRNYTNESYPKGEGVEDGRLHVRSGSFNRIEQSAIYHNGLPYAGEGGSPIYIYQSSSAEVSAILSHQRENTTGYIRLTSDKVTKIKKTIDDITPNDADLVPLPTPRFEAFTNQHQNPGTLLDTLSVGVTNYSEKGFLGSIVWRIILSKDETFSSDDVVLNGGIQITNFNILPKESIYFTASNLLNLPNDIQEGNYFIGSYLEVNDTDQTNNFPLQGDLRPIIIGNPELDNPLTTLDCQDAIPLDCDKFYTFNNTNTENNFNNDNDLYDDCLTLGSELPNANDYNANDLLFTFEIETASDVSIQLKNLTSSFDAFLFKKCENSKLSKCEGFGTRGGKVPETIDLIDAVGTYYLIVDATKTNQVGQFELTLISSDCGAVDNICTNARSLTCGIKENYTTIGAQNNFVYQDYEGICVERIGASENPFDAPDQLFQFDVSETQDATITMSDLNADLDLFVFQACADGTLSECLTRSISFGIADEKVTIEDAFGTYYLVVDGYKASEQSGFSLSLDCTAPTITNARKPTVCDLPADFINNGVNKIPSLSLDASDTKLNTVEIDENIAADFGTNPSDDVVFDSYIFHLSEDSPTNFFGVNTRTIFDDDNPDRPNPNIYVYRCACENEVCGPQFVKRSNIENEDGDNFLLDPAAPGFYYIIIVGEIENIYDMNLIPEGPCKNDARLYTLGTTVQNDLSFAINRFDRTGESEYDIFGCYEGTRKYTGGDIIYQIRVEETQKTTFNLSSMVSSGMFLYDFMCGGECIASAENVGDNTIASIDTIYLTPGIYHLVIDQAVDTELGKFTLSSESEASELPEYFDFLILNCLEESIGNQVIVLSPSMRNTTLGSTNITDDFEFLLYSEEVPIPKFSSRNNFAPSYFSFSDNYVQSLTVASEERDSSCHYIENHRLKIKAHHTTTGGVFDTDINFQTGDNRVTEGRTSVITGLTGRPRGTFVVTNSTLVMPSSGGSSYFYVQADPNTSWQLNIGNSNKIGNTIQIDPSNLNREFVGTQAIRVIATANNSNLLNILPLNITSEDGFYQSVTIYQKKQGGPIPNLPNIEIDNFEKRIKLYPNPTRESLQIDLPLEVSEIESMIFYDAFGRQMQLPYQPSSVYTLEVNTLQLLKGVYFVELQLDQKIIVKKFMVVD